MLQGLDAPGHRHRLARRPERLAERVFRLPAHRRHAALQHLLGRAGADAQDAARGQRPPHGLLAADPLQEDIIGGVVAVRQGQHQEAVDGGPVALVGEQLLDRLIEHAHVAAGHQHGVVQPEPPALHRVEDGQRRPQLGDALLRIGPVGVVARDPAGRDVLDRDAHPAVERAGQRVDRMLQPGWPRRRRRQRLQRQGRAGGEEQKRGEGQSG